MIRFSAANSDSSYKDSKSSDIVFDFNIIHDFACLYEASNPSGALLVGKNRKQYIYPWTWEEQKLKLSTSLKVIHCEKSKKVTRIAMQECWIALCTQTFENDVNVQFWKKEKKRYTICILNIRSSITHFIGLEKGLFCLATKQQLVIVNCHGVEISGKISHLKNIRYYDSELKVVDRKNIITYDIHLKELSRENHSNINLWESLWCGITSDVLAIRLRPQLDLNIWKKEFANRVNAKSARMSKRAAILDPCGEVLITFEENCEDDLNDGKLDLQSKGKLLGSMPADDLWSLRYLSASRQIIIEDNSNLCMGYLVCYELASEGSEVWRVDIGHRNDLRIHESGNQLFLLTNCSFSILKTSGIDNVEEKVLFRSEKS